MWYQMLLYPPCTGGTTNTGFYYRRQRVRIMGGLYPFMMEFGWQS